MQKQIELNVEYQNQLKKDIEDTMPFITDLVDLAVLKEEYRDNKFENCFDDLVKRYSRVRRLRRDGNCFYRAFLFQVFEHFIHNKDSKLYEQVIANVEKSKKDLMEIGYDEIAIEDFWDVFMSELKKLKTIDADKAT